MGIPCICPLSFSLGPGPYRRRLSGKWLKRVRTHIFGGVAPWIGVYMLSIDGN